ncbi:MAG: dihydroneopterin aldolase family protein [Halobacteria archaeon]
MRARAARTEVAAFEAGIKLGAIYHQFIGTPVTPATARALERAMEGALRAMPFCTRARVRIDRRALRKGLNRFGYAELKGSMLSAEVEVAVPGARARSRVVRRGAYPWMELTGVRGSGRNRYR